MTGAEYEKFYSSDVYRRLYSGPDFLTLYRSTRYNVQTGRHIFEAISTARTIGPGLRVLEVGAGGGWNLLPFQQAGAEILGLDYSASLVELGCEQGIRMITGGLEDIESEFDVIILSHVLEHFLEPRAALGQLLGHLRPSGLLYIEVPNILQFGMGQIQLAHTYYFTPRTLQNTAQSCGLKLLSSGVALNIHQYGIFSTGLTDTLTHYGADPTAYREVRSAIRLHRWKEPIRSLAKSFGLLTWGKCLLSRFR